MAITPDQLVSREVHYCVSALVSTLADRPDDGPRFRAATGNAIADLCWQAVELAMPLPDYESAVTEAGWSLRGEGDTGQSWRNDAPDFDGFDMESPEAICNEFGIEPHDREVYEHWIISDWLADRLEAHGEKIDKDFAGLTVWARTCSGQAIALDSVIVDICVEVNAA